MYYAEFCYKDVTMPLMSVSGRIFDSLLRNIHYIGQKRSLQDKQANHTCTIKMAVTYYMLYYDLPVPAPP